MSKSTPVEPGDKFGRWTALQGRVSGNGAKAKRWFRCDCGTERLAQEYDVRVGKSKSCGCLSDEAAAVRGKAIAGRFAVGDRIGRLVIVSDEYESRRNGRHWKCVCDCGAEVMAAQSSLSSGQNVSCGCYSREKAKLVNTIHGHNSWKEPPSSTYNSWRGAKERCTKPDHIGYSRYGGRGITMCPRWTDSFAAFLKDMGPKPTPQHTLERMDGNKGYEPGNCCWASRQEQANNKSNNRFYEYDGKRLTLREWSDLTGVTYAALYSRINGLGWSLERAFKTPKK